ncbi:MAG: hypothetical protein AAF985_00880, partial [Bacteroidota bacterium]
MKSNKAMNQYLKVAVLLSCFLIFFNTATAQIKSMKKVEYLFYRLSTEKGFHKKMSKDSCVIFWEKYDQQGRLILEHDLSGGGCWKKEGPSEHQLFYDDRDRLIERRIFLGEEGQVKPLKEDIFYSYPDQNDPERVEEFRVLYQTAANSDTLTVDSFYRVRPEDILENQYIPVVVSYDTLQLSNGYLIIDRKLPFNKDLVDFDQYIPFFAAKDLKKFEKLLLKKAKSITAKIPDILPFKNKDGKIANAFEFQNLDRTRSITFINNDYTFGVVYKIYNESGEDYLLARYEYGPDTEELTKVRMIRTYIERY